MKFLFIFLESRFLRYIENFCEYWINSYFLKMLITISCLNEVNQRLTTPLVFLDHFCSRWCQRRSIFLGPFIILVSVVGSTESTMISFNRRCWDNFDKAAIKHDPNFEEGVDIVAISPFKDSEIRNTVIRTLT